MNNRTIIGLTMVSFAAGIGAVIAYRLPADSLSAIAAMALTAVILIVVMTVVMAIMAWMAVRITRPPQSADAGRVGTQAYPPVMVFGQPAQPLLPNGYEQTPAGGGPRSFTIIGDSDDDEDE